MDGLRNEQSVERISMKSEQIVDPERVPEVHQKHPDGVAGELIFEVGRSLPGRYRLPLGFLSSRSSNLIVHLLAEDEETSDSYCYGYRQH